MIRRLLAVLLALACGPALAQEGETRRTEAVIWLRIAAPTSADDLRLGDFWVDYDASPVVSYILTDDSPVTWTAFATGSAIGHKIQDEGVSLTARDTLDFAGAGITCADSGGTKTLCTVPSGGYATIEEDGTPLTQRGTLNFTGDNITCADVGGETECSTFQFYGLVNVNGVGMDPAGNLDFEGDIVTGTDIFGATRLTFPDYGASAAGLGNSSSAGVASEVSRRDHAHKRDVRVAKGGSDVGTRNRLNLIEGSNVTLTVTDDAGNDEVDVTIASSGGAGGTPASTVEDETTLGISSAVGTDTEYARQDHTHGSVSESNIEAAVDLQDLQGAVTDAQVPNTITVDQATLALTGDSATAFFSAGTIEDARIDGSAEADEVTLSGDIDGPANANDIDEVTIEAELETVLDIPDLQGVLPLAKLTDDATDSLCLLSGGAGSDPFWAACSSGSGVPSIAAEYIVAEANGTLSAEVAPSAANQVPVSSSSTAAAWGTVPIAAGGTGQTSQTNAFDALSPLTTQGDVMYHNGSDNVRLAKGVAYQHLRMNSGATAPEWGTITGVLAAPVAVAVNATYVTVFTVQPIASKTNNVQFRIYHAASATTIGMQFRVSSADTGNVGICSFTHFGINATVSSSVDVFHVQTAIAAAPADTVSLASFSTAFNTVYIDCAFTSDGTPGTIVLEAQLETGTTSTNILAGSAYTYTFN